MAQRVIFVDRGLRQIVRQLQQAGDARLRVGVVGTPAQQRHPESDLTVGQVALINHYGTRDGHIPERPFVTEAFRDVGLVQRELMAAARAMILQGLPHDEALRRVGERLARVVKEVVERSTGMARNAPSTIAKKGFDHPLIDRATLVEAIGYEIVRRAASDEYDAMMFSGEGTV